MTCATENLPGKYLAPRLCTPVSNTERFQIKINLSGIGLFSDLQFFNIITEDGLSVTVKERTAATMSTHPRGFPIGRLL